MQLFWYTHKDQLLDISIKPSNYYEFPRNLDFKWIVKEYSQDKLILQLEFDNAVDISTGL